MRVLIAVLVLAAAGCGPMFDSPLAPEPTPWVLPAPGPSPCPGGHVKEPVKLGAPIVCLPASSD